MNTGMVLAAVALLTWPTSVASQRLRDLDGGDAHRTGALSDRIRGLVSRLPVRVVLPVVAGMVAGVAAGPLHACAVALVTAAVMELRARAGARRRSLAALGAWERALDDAASVLRAGAGPALALERAAEGTATADSAVASTLSMAASHARLGGDVSSALGSTHRDAPGVGTHLGSSRWIDRGATAGRGAWSGDGRVVGTSAGVGAHAASPVMGRVAGELAGAWMLSTRHGVVLADAVDGLRADVASRRERAQRVDATLAGPRATAVILTALPGFGILLGSGFGADPLGVLLTGTLGGVLCLAGAVFLTAGLLWTDRIAGGAL